MQAAISLPGLNCCAVRLLNSPHAPPQRWPHLSASCSHSRRQRQGWEKRGDRPPGHPDTTHPSRSEGRQPGPPRPSETHPEQREENITPGRRACGRQPKPPPHDLLRRAFGLAMGGGGSVWALAMGWALAVLGGGAGGLDSGCLAGGKHKPAPSPEEQLGVCQLYAANACCSPKVAQEISRTPLAKGNDIYWNRCGTFSPRCEHYLQRVECFYRCSPSAARWPHPQRPTAVLGVPLCLSFCEEWYEACKDDLTCARDWLSDWQWGPEGNNCSGDCVPYSQMYRAGSELCENIWGDSFVAAREPCLSLGASDPEPLAEDGGSSEEPDATGAGGPRGPCPASGPPRRARGRRGKRSIFMEDVEGSGSGF